MARRRKGLPVHGWLIFDKPQGMTSTQAVARVKRLYEAAKAGHAGTLDPLATGVLPIALGEATKTVPFVVEGSKEYRFTVRLGTELHPDALALPADAQREDPLSVSLAPVLLDFAGWPASHFSHSVPPSSRWVACIVAQGPELDVELLPRDLVQSLGRAQV